MRLDTTRSSPGIDRSAFYSIYYGPNLDLYHTDTLLSGNVQLDYSVSNVFSVFLGGIDNTVVKTYQNVDATIYGGEASARVSLPWNLFASGRISYTRGENDTYDTNLPEMPPLMGGLSLRYDVETWFGEAEWVGSARQDKTDPQVQEQPTPGWAIVNLKAGCQYKGLRLFAGVKNLFEKYYTEYLSYLRDPFATGVKVPEPGMTLYANLQYSF